MKIRKALTGALLNETGGRPVRPKRWLPRPGFWAVGAVLVLAGGMQFNAVTQAVPEPPYGMAHTLKPVQPDFLWGVATAGYQWEGGDRASNWAHWERQGKVKEPSGKAANGWAMYEHDLDLAKGMGLNAFRLSIEWSRIEPKKGEIDWSAVEHYRRVLKAAHDRGLEPIVTLLHYTYPAWLDAEAPKGRAGWESEAAVEHYARYVDFIARQYGQDIRYYLTFNEPTVMVEGGYLAGVWPPGKKDLPAFFRASANLIKAHSRAYDAIHRHDADAMVSFNNYAAAYELGLDPKKDALPVPGDDWFLKAFSNAFLPKLADKKRIKLDYVAVDYYKRLTLPMQVIPPSPSQWHVHPEGFSDVLMRYHKAFGLPILVAENGFATDNGKPRADGWDRETYMVSHIAAVQQAIAQGVPVIGYTYWTLTDNYEWGSFNDRFGLYRVECREGDFTRHETPAVDVYRRIVENRGVTPKLLAEFAFPSAERAANKP